MGDLTCRTAAFTAVQSLGTSLEPVPSFTGSGAGSIHHTESRGARPSCSSSLDERSHPERAGQLGAEITADRQTH